MIHIKNVMAGGGAYVGLLETVYLEYKITRKMVPITGRASSLLEIILYVR